MSAQPRASSPSGICPIWPTRGSTTSSSACTRRVRAGDERASASAAASSAAGSPPQGGPHDGGDVRPGQRVAELGLGTRPADGRPLDDAGDDGPALSMAAAVELIALGLEDREDGVEGVVDEGGDGQQRDVEELVEEAQVLGELEADRHPAPRGQALAGAVAVQRGKQTLQRFFAIQQYTTEFDN